MLGLISVPGAAGLTQVKPGVTPSTANRPGPGSGAEFGFIVALQMRYRVKFSPTWH